MSRTVDKARELFMTASLSDDDLGYPDRVAFIPGDQEWADDALWHNLTEGRATVLDRLRGRVGVSVTQRIHGRPAPYATASRLGRHPVRQMRELAHA